MRIQMLAAAVLLICSSTPALVLSQQGFGAPETFSADLLALGATGGAGSATIQINVQRYTPEADRTAVEAALKSGAYPAFLTALRQAPEVGSVVFGNRTWTIRWARERPTLNGRAIVLVTDKPIHFVGGGSIDAKPRAGYEVAVIQIRVDDAGMGDGSMAAAAKVKSGGDTGVMIDDYAEQPIKLTKVVRKIQ
jgi:hypothetical protein